MEKKVTSNVVKGLIISLIIMVISIAAYFAGPAMAEYAKWGSLIILCAGIIWACTSYGNQMNHQVTFGNVFSHGFKTTAVVTVITIVFTVVFFMVFPEMKEQAMDTARQQMEGKKMSDNEIEMGMNMMNKSFMIFLVMGSLFFYMILGLIASLIGAAVTKKNPPTPFETQA